MNNNLINNLKHGTSIIEIEKRLLYNSLKIDNYLKTINDLKNTNLDLTKDNKISEEYQKNFNRYYRIRKSKDKWQKEYYKIFEKHRNDTILEFDKLLDEIYDIDLTVEPSFTSKMLATINPNNPIWDQYVLNNLNITIKTPYDKEEVKLKYKELKNTMNELLNNKNMIKKIKEFKNKYNLNNITDVKILDLILWQIRDNK